MAVCGVVIVCYFLGRGVSEIRFVVEKVYVVLGVWVRLCVFFYGFV